MFYKKETEEVLQELHTSENGLNKGFFPIFVY